MVGWLCGVSPGIDTLVPISSKREEIVRGADPRPAPVFIWFADNRSDGLEAVPRRDPEPVAAEPPAAPRPPAGAAAGPPRLEAGPELPPKGLLAPRDDAAGPDDDDPEAGP